MYKSTRAYLDREYQVKLIFSFSFFILRTKTLGVGAQLDSHTELSRCDEGRYHLAYAEHLGDVNYQGDYADPSNFAAIDL